MRTLARGPEIRTGWDLTKITRPSAPTWWAAMKRWQTLCQDISLPATTHSFWIFRRLKRSLNIPGKHFKWHAGRSLYEYPASCQEGTPVTNDLRLAKEIQDLIAEKLAVQVAAEDTDLLTDGVLDSVTLVHLILHLEQKFQIR